MRYGKFSVPRCEIDDNLGKYIFDGTVIPVRVELVWCTDTLDVAAISDRFDVLGKGEDVPFYDYEFVQEEIKRRDITGLPIGWSSVKVTGIRWTRRAP